MVTEKLILAPKIFLYKVAKLESKDGTKFSDFITVTFKWKQVIESRENKKKIIKNIIFRTFSFFQAKTILGSPKKFDWCLNTFLISQALSKQGLLRKDL